MSEPHQYPERWLGGGFAHSTNRRQNFHRFLLSSSVQITPPLTNETQLSILVTTKAKRTDMGSQREGDLMAGAWAGLILAW